MPEAVIVATGRTPIGRANKGSLVECRPDDLSALVIREVLATPRVSKTSCGAPGSLQVRPYTTWHAWPPSSVVLPTCPASP